MRCTRARSWLPLHAGGDLPESDTAALENHLRECEDCARELAALRNTLRVVARIAAADVPDPFPEDFDLQVARALERRSARRGRSIVEIFRPLTWKPAWLIAGMALIVLVLIRIVQLPPGSSDPIGVQVDGVWPYVKEGDSHPVTVHALETAFSGCLEGPFPLDSWDAPLRPGVYAIMHKPDPDDHPHAYVVDYCGESNRLASYRNYPWLQQRVTRLVSRSGSEDNLYIAYCPMPESTRKVRRDLQRALIDQFEPYFNRRRGI